jgi:hypothetical protein
MSTRTNARRAMLGAALGDDLAKKLGLPVLASTDTDISGANSTATKSLRDYVIQKHFLAAGRFRTFWYFGKCTSPLGGVVPGTERLSSYPLRMYDDAGNGGYGSLNLGTQDTNGLGRIVVTSARVNLTTTVSNTNAVGTGITIVGSEPGTDFSVGTAQFTSATHSTLTTTKANVIASTACDMTTGAGSALAHSGVNTVITNNGGGTASTTWAAITATVTSTVVADALAQLAANENKRLGLMGLVVDGTSSAQSLFLNWIIDDADQAATADNNIVGEILLNGVIEVSGEVQGDI